MPPENYGVLPILLLYTKLMHYHTEKKFSFQVRTSFTMDANHSNKYHLYTRNMTNTMQSSNLNGVL